MAEFIRQALVRPVQYTWLIVGRFGTPILPHVFCAARILWNYDAAEMKLIHASLAAMQLVPGGAGDAYLSTLGEFAARAASKGDGKVTTVADLSRSIELRTLVYRRLPGAAVARVTGGQEDDYAYPARLCGRVLLMSRLQAWLTDRKLTAALPKADDDSPNVWDWPKVRGALSAAQAKPPKVDDKGDVVADPQTTEDDVTLCVAQVCWWGFAGRPSPYAKVTDHDALGITTEDRQRIIEDARRDR